MDIGTTKMIARKEGGIGWMIFNQPEKHNAVSYDMWLAVPKIIAAFEEDPEVRVIVRCWALASARSCPAPTSLNSTRSAAPRRPSRSTTTAGSCARGARLEPSSRPSRMIRGICYRRRRRHRAATPTFAFAPPIPCSPCLPQSLVSVIAMPASSGWSTSSGRAFAKEIFFSANRVHRRGRAHHGPRQPRGSGARAGRLRAHVRVHDQRQRAAHHQGGEDGDQRRRGRP